MAGEQENATQNAIAGETGSAPVELTVPEVNAVDTESAPVVVDGNANTEVEGAEPSKAVKDLIIQRRKRQEAERALEYYKGLAEGRGGVGKSDAVPVKTAAAEVVEPSLDDFASYEEYEEAKTNFIVHRAKVELMTEFKRTQSEQQAQEQSKTFQERLNTAAADDPDLLDIANDLTLPINSTMAEIVRGSDSAPAMLKWLDSNRKEAARIAQLSPIASAHAMGKVEALLAAGAKPTPPRQVSQAPSPISTVGPAGASIVDEEALPMGEYIRRKNAEQYKRRHSG